MELTPLSVGLNLGAVIISEMTSHNYLNLLKLVLTRYFLEPPMRFQPVRLNRFSDKLALWVIRKNLGRSAELCEPRFFEPSSRENGLD